MKNLVDSICKQTLESLVEGYFGELKYIVEFKNFKKGTSKDKDHSLKNFLKYYNVLRNIKGAGNEKNYENFENVIRGFINNNSSKANNVDLLVAELNKITHTNLTSLCSKVLFLNNPCEVFPMDSFSITGLNLIFATTNNKLNRHNYSEYIKKVKEFKKEKINEVKEFLKSAEVELAIITSIEKYFNGQIKNIEEVRINRFVDKYLLFKGR